MKYRTRKFYLPCLTHFVSFLIVITTQIIACAEAEPFHRIGEVTFSGNPVGIIRDIAETPIGTVLAAENGLFILTGDKVKKVSSGNRKLGGGTLINLHLFESELWIVEYGVGIFKLKLLSGELQYIDIDKATGAWDLTIIDNRMLVSTIDEILVVDRVSGEVIKTLKTINNEKISSAYQVASNNNSFYFFTENQLVELNAKTLKINVMQRQSEFPNLNYFSAINARDSKVYIGGDRGLYELNIHNDTRKFYSLEDYPHLPIDEIFISKQQNIWIGAGNLFKLHANHEKIARPSWLNPVLSTESSQSIIAIDESENEELKLVSSQLGLIVVSKLTESINFLHDETGIYRGNIKFLYSLDGKSIYGVDQNRHFEIDQKSGRLNYKNNGNNETVFEGMCSDILSSYGWHEEGCGSLQNFKVSVSGDKAYIYTSNGESGYIYFLENNYLVERLSAPSNIEYMAVTEHGDLVGLNSLGEILSQRTKTVWLPLSKLDRFDSDATCFITISPSHIWICRSDNGIDEVSLADGTIKKVINSELTTKYIRGAAKIGDQQVLVATNVGLILIDVISGYAIQLGESEGVLDVDFDYDSVTTINSHTIVLGDRYPYFFDNTLLKKLVQERKKQVSRAAIESVSFEQNDANEKVFMDTVISGNRLKIPYDSSEIKFSVSTLDYAQRKVQSLEYRISNVDLNWNKLGLSNGVVRYSSLPSGKYTFEVRVIDPKSNSTQPITKVNFEILSSFYLSWPAIAAYIILISAFCFFVYARNKGMLGMFSSRLGEVVSEQQSALESSQGSVKKLNEEKQKMFVNLSHEIRTPITIINGLLGQLHAGMDPPMMEEKIKKVTRNATRLSYLADQIIEIENLDLTANDARKFVRIAESASIIMSNVEPLASINKIDLSYSVAGDMTIPILGDSLETIIYNLVSNATKYTDEHGSVVVEFLCEELFLVIKVTDTGRGMSVEERESIFERFSRLNSSKDTKGHGVGLALVQDIVSSHNGWINVSSEVDVGSTFTVFLPRYETQVLPIDMSDRGVTEIERQSNEQMRDASLDSVRNSDKKIVLLVEDSDDLRDYLCDELKSKFSCLNAKNGKEAIDIIGAVTPHVIVTDFVMPKMDGLSLLKELWNSQSLAHIPVIVLTSIGDQQTQSRFYEAGADHVLMKPAVIEELVPRIEQVISVRAASELRFEEIKNRFFDIQPEDTDIPDFKNSRDQVFFLKFKQIIEENFSDELFNRATAADKLAMSDRQLNRKLSELLDYNFNEYLKKFRLRKSKPFLVEQMPVTTVAYEVGFNSPSYFSTCFKLEYGLSPKNFQERIFNDKKCSADEST